MRNRSIVTLKRAFFPGIAAIISFLFFVIIFYSIIRTVIEPDYLIILLFALPFVLFGTIFILTVKDKINETASIISTGILIIPLAIAIAFIFLFVSIDTATTTTTDINRYERVLKLSNLPNHLLKNTFPDEVPANAENIMFMYHPSFGQGGEAIALKFELDSESIKEYIAVFPKKAKWVGKVTDSEASKHGVFIGTFNAFGSKYDSHSRWDGYTVFVIFSQPYEPNNWNHGEISFVAISEHSNEIFFYADKW